MACCFEVEGFAIVVVKSIKWVATTTTTIRVKLLFTCLNYLIVSRH